MAAATRHPELALWEIRPSVFSEKARWALGWKGLAYRSRELMPGFHGLILTLRGRGATVPALDIGERRVSGSAAINEALEELRPEPPLYPADPEGRARARRLEAEFDGLGHEVRRVLLDPILREPPTLTHTMLARRPAYERRVTEALYPVAERIVRRRWRIGRQDVVRAQANVMAGLDRLESELGGEGYLVGAQFSVADMAAAALLGMLLWPDEYPEPPWKAAPFPAPLRELRESLAARPAGQFVLEMYRRHRRSRIPAAAESLVRS